MDKWIKQYVDAVMTAFAERVWFIGIQGSWGRGEATASSDIDMVLILDTVSYMDLQTYDSLLTVLLYRDKVCGFVSGIGEIKNWVKSDLFQFCNDTTAIYGSLDELLLSVQRTDVVQAVKMGVCNIYHGCVHNIIHEKSPEILKDLYKATSFTLRAIVYLEKGVFVKKERNLLDMLDSSDRCILEQLIFLKNSIQISSKQFALLSEMLFQWASKRMQGIQM